MNVKVESVQADVAPLQKGKRGKKVKYTNSHLPFPTARIAPYTQKWRKAFKPSIINWAATHDDPFGTNAIMDDPIKKVWSEVFPDLKDCMTRDEDRAAVVGVVRR